MICLVGDILTDVNLSLEEIEPKMRLGGIIHAARILYAMDVEYSVAYFAPSYMKEHIDNCLKEYNCKESVKLGNVEDNPYIILIKEAKEIGNQGYEFLYRDSVNISYSSESLERLSTYENIFLISGNYDIKKIFKFLNPSSKIYLDCANNLKSLDELVFPVQLRRLFISTSSELFIKEYTDFPAFCNLFKGKTTQLVIKENRGGSIGYDYETRQKYEIPSFISEIQHSVGVGDAFDVVSIEGPDGTLEDQLYRASWIAKEYADTTFVDDLKRDVKRSLNIPINKIKIMGGCFLPWEERQKCHLYLAAPDFDYIDNRILDRLEESLLYHNFVPHRPVKENGQLLSDSSESKRRELFNKDMELLQRCNMLIAVLPYNDPGTLIEIGIASQLKIPVILFDPKKSAYNCMLTELPDKICTVWDELIVEVFKIYSKMYKDGKLK